MGCGPTPLEGPAEIVPFRFSNQSANQSRAKTIVIASDCLTISMLVTSLQTKIRDSHAHRILDDHDFAITDHCSTHQDVDIVAGRARDSNYALRMQFKHLRDGHHLAPKFRFDIQWDVGKIGDLFNGAHRLFDQLDGVLAQFVY